MKKLFVYCREALLTFLYILTVVLAILLCYRYLGQKTQVIGDSMTPALSDGDHIIIEKLSYHWSSPQRFDIIVFPNEFVKNANYIKRIIGLPGETVRIDEKGIIYINEEPLEEYYGNETILYAGLAKDSIELSEDEYFVLGDNRNDSMDSRLPEVGMIKRSEIVGRAWLRIWPLNAFGTLNSQ